MKKKEDTGLKNIFNISAIYSAPIANIHEDNDVCPLCHFKGFHAMIGHKQCMQCGAKYKYES